MIVFHSSGTRSVSTPTAFKSSCNFSVMGPGTCCPSRRWGRRIDAVSLPGVAGVGEQLLGLRRVVGVARSRSDRIGVALVEVLARRLAGAVDQLTTPSRSAA